MLIFLASHPVIPQFWNRVLHSPKVPGARGVGGGPEDVWWGQRVDSGTRRPLLSNLCFSQMGFDLNSSTYCDS